MTLGMEASASAATPTADPNPVKIKQNNKETPLTRNLLESLSTGELAKLADHYGIDIPGGIERIFIIEELLDIESNDENVPDNDIETGSHFMETAALPKHYNISFVEVIIRDPLWAFVFWEIKEHDRTVHENAQDFEGYCLRVVPVNEDARETLLQNTEQGGASDSCERESFTVVIGANDTARYIGFTEDEAGTANQDGSMPGRRYIIRLCAIRSGQEIQLAASRPFTLPRLIEKDSLSSGVSKDINNLYQNPCICLSGVRDFSVAKSTDRQLRVKRQ